MEIRTNLGDAGQRLRQAGQDIGEAGGAGAALARDVARDTAEALEVARERATDVASAVGERASDAAEAVVDRGQRAAVAAGRTAVGVTAQAINVPGLVREGTRRGVELIENAGSKLVVSVLDAGSRALNAAAEYVSEIVPRRRVRRAVLEQLVLEQLAWTECGTETLERSASEIDDDALRVRLVRCKLQTIRHAETLAQLLHDFGARTPSPDRMPETRPATVAGGRERPDGRARHDLASALSAATQEAEGWRALAQVAATAEPEGLSAAVGRACEAVGAEVDERVALLRTALVERTVGAVLM